MHRIVEGRTLVYFQESGHLGFWTHQVSTDGGSTWEKPATSAIDTDAFPLDSPVFAHAGSYQTTWGSPDGRTLHIAFIRKVEYPIDGKRYGAVLHDNTGRHNLY